jgi:hypothetical protein
MTSASVTHTEIHRAIEAIIAPGQVVELRALGVTTSAYPRRHTVSGYFDDMGQLAQAAASLPRAKGVYFTPNPLNPALLSRAANRLRIVDRQDPLTSDGDVLAHRWLLIDCDAVRPAGISSTDAEHELAFARMQECHAWLQDQGWPAGIEADSGNGGHLLCRIDLPNDAPAASSSSAVLKPWRISLTMIRSRSTARCITPHGSGNCMGQEPVRVMTPQLARTDSPDCGRCRHDAQFRIPRSARSLGEACAD